MALPIAAAIAAGIPLAQRAMPAITRITPQLVNQALKDFSKFGGRITPQNIQDLGKFAQLVETNKARGALGQAGQRTQGFVDAVFGRQVTGGFSNKQVKEAIDMLLQNLKVR